MSDPLALCDTLERSIASGFKEFTVSEITPLLRALREQVARADGPSALDVSLLRTWALTLQREPAGTVFQAGWLLPVARIIEDALREQVARAEEYKTRCAVLSGQIYDRERAYDRAEQAARELRKALAEMAHAALKIQSDWEGTRMGDALNEADAARAATAWLDKEGE